jgi:hypothetical protein
MLSPLYIKELQKWRLGFKGLNRLPNPSDWEIQISETSLFLNKANKAFLRERTFGGS